MAELNEVGFTAGVLDADVTGEVPTLAPVRDAIEDCTAAIEALQTSMEALAIATGTLSSESTDVLSVQDLSTQGARSLKTVSPNDASDLPDGVCRGLWVSAAGTLVVVAEDDHVTNDERNLGTVAAGQVIPIRVKRVYDTGTDATVLAMY